MLAGKSPAQLRELKRLGLDQPASPSAFGLGPPPRRDDDDDEEAVNPADRVVVEWNPADDSLDAERIAHSLHGDDLPIVAEHFRQSLIWASQAKSLVEMGWRVHAMIRVFRPAVLEGMTLEAKIEYERDLVKWLGAGRRALARVGEIYWLTFAWCARCVTVSQLGQRGFAMVYNEARSLLGTSNTNAALGGLGSKTRQAFNRTVQDYRDAHHGARNDVMRDEETRIKCKVAHTN
jgi:hypothetical protein